MEIQICKDKQNFHMVQVLKLFSRVSWLLDRNEE